METRFLMTNKTLIKVLHDVEVSDLRVIAETALLYYAKYLKENPQIIDPILDVNKLEFNVKKNDEDKSKCEEISKLKNSLALLYKYEGKSSDAEEKRGISIRFNSNNEMVQQIIELCKPRNGVLIETAMLYYLCTLKADLDVVDFRINL